MQSIGECPCVLQARQAPAPRRVPPHDAPHAGAQSALCGGVDYTQADEGRAWSWAEYGIVEHSAMHGWCSPRWRICNMELTLGEETITTFRQALERVTALAHAKLPAELHGHLERATALVIHRHVWLGEDGRHAQVFSSDGQTWYRVNGACTCMDAPSAPQGLCKHRLAVSFTAAPASCSPRPRAAAAPAAAAALPEAPASVNVRLCVDGARVPVYACATRTRRAWSSAC